MSIYCEPRRIPLPPIYDYDDFVCPIEEGTGVGLQGTQGLQGIQGLEGVSNTIGLQGITGFQGNQGVTATIIGTQGQQGSQGDRGFQGTGDIGLQGIQGVTGLGSAYTLVREVLGTTGATAFISFENLPTTTTQVILPYFGLQGVNVGAFGFQLGDGTTGFYGVGYTGGVNQTQTAGGFTPYSNFFQIRTSGSAVQRYWGIATVTKLYDNQYVFSNRGGMDNGGIAQFIQSTGYITLPNPMTRIRLSTTGDLNSGANISCLYI